MKKNLQVSIILMSTFYFNSFASTVESSDKSVGIVSSTVEKGEGGITTVKSPQGAVNSSRKETQLKADNVDKVRTKMLQHSSGDDIHYMIKNAISNQNSDNLTYAYSNSPNDGFLSLRTQPSIYEGSRILKIPHNEIVEVLNCPDETRDVVSNNRDNWCIVRYKNSYGFVFGHYLRYTYDN